MRLLGRGIFQARILEWVAIPYSGVIFPTQESNPRPPALADRFFVFEPPGKPQMVAVSLVQVLPFVLCLEFPESFSLSRDGRNQTKEDQETSFTLLLIPVSPAPVKLP